MPKGYWIAQVDVDDFETYRTYIAANAAPFKEFGGRFLVRGGTRDVPEGAVRGRTIVLEFPSYAEAIACYHSPSYQAAKTLRDPVSTSDLVIIEGYEG